LSFAQDGGTEASHFVRHEHTQHGIVRRTAEEAVGCRKSFYPFKN